MSARRWALVGALSVLGTVAATSGAACDSTDAPTLTIPDGCNPIAPAGECLLPYPSDVFRVDGAVQIGADASPKFQGFPADLVSLHRPDGFSVGSPILALFPSGVDDSNLVFWKTDVARSREPSSPTVLLDATSGERILHFAELDPRATDDARRALIIRPLVRLEHGHRYIVAIHGLRDKAGDAIEAPPAFADLRDDEGRGHPRLDAMSLRYDREIFAPLEAAGIARETLQLAWDFTTTSEEGPTKDTLAMRDELLAKLDADGPVVKIVKVETDTNEHVAKRIEATVTVPLWVDSPDPGGALVYGNDGVVTAKTTFDVPFTIWIPKSVANRTPGSPPARLMQFGHGFFGGRVEADGFPAELADEEGFVVVATDWWGLADPDKLAVADSLVTDPSRTTIFTDRLQQAMMNFIAVAAAAKGPLAALPELQIQGAPAYDASTLYYYGISLGAILGSTYVTLSPYVDRAALSVGAANFSLMLFRSRAFLPFLGLLGITTPDPLEQQKVGALLQSGLDRIDPMTYAPHMLEKRYPKNPKTLDVAMQIGLGDPAVPNIASFYQARILGVPVLEPTPLEPFGVPTIPSPVTGSAMTLFDFGVPQVDVAQASLNDNEVHEGVRRTAGSKAQLDAFFRPGGAIVQACDGACDPE
ncbi:MAG: hypothetical protein U0414_14305 [Polyangiaceae bacterium]